MTAVDDALDPEAMTRYRTYFTDFFDGRFRTGMGTEHILDAVAAVGGAGDWIDLGAGPCTLFWSLALDDARSIRAVDHAPEALAVLREAAGSDRTPPCFTDVLARHGRDEAHLRRMRDAVVGTHVFDAMRPWPAELDGHEFDLVTEFGLFGLAPTVPGYRDCFRNLRGHVRAGGTVIGADWVRSPALVASEGHDNTYLTAELVAGAVADAGLRLVSTRWCPIEGDELYDALIVWRAER